MAGYREHGYASEHAIVGSQQNLNLIPTGGGGGGGGGDGGGGGGLCRSQNSTISMRHTSFVSRKER